jgi:hypothetical protein
MNEEGQAFGKKKGNAHSCEHPSLFFKKSKRAVWFLFFVCMYVCMYIYGYIIGGSHFVKLFNLKKKFFLF